jgi:hypothetical protein
MNVLHRFGKQPALLSFLLFAATVLTFQESWAQQSDSIAAYVEAMHEKILSEGKTTQYLTEDDLASLPIGLYKNASGLDYMIIIDSARFTPQGAFFNAYIILEFNSNGKKLAFAGRNIGFQPGGLSASTGSRMVLISAETFDIVKDKITLTLPAENNFVEFDCNGFKSVNLQGVFEFAPSFLVPEAGAGPNGATPDKVRATFEVNSTDWGSILASTSITPFQIPSVKGLSFSVTDAMLDLSDILNPPNFQFPPDYQHSYGADINHWQGFFLRETKIKIFDELSTKQGKTEIVTQNLILDKSGVSFNFGVKNLFERNEGSLGGWPFSVDSLGVSVVRNQLRGGALKGLVNIPLFSDDAPCKYTALISQGPEHIDYLFAIQPGDSLEADVLGAHIVLLPASTFMVTRANGKKLQPEAILHGFATIKNSDKIRIKNIAFTDLHLASQAPYIRSGNWALTTTNKKAGDKTDANNNENDLGKFPIVINSITFSHSQDLLRLGVQATLNLMNKEDKGFAATASIEVTGELHQVQEVVGEETVTRQDWRYRSTNISDILVDVKGGVYKIFGRISMYDKDPVYGNGFRGEVSAEFTPGVAIKAIAQFGNVNSMRYWYVDGQLRLPTPVGGGAFGIYGFGGGIYYHMLLQRPDVYAAQDLVSVTGNADKNNIGASRSGSRYVPDASVGLGLKATVILGTIPSEPFNGDATFEIAFNSSGGVRLIRFRGEGYFMTPIEQRSAQAPIYADLDIIYDFTNKALHANLDTYVNLYGGLLKGIHPGGLAGSAVLHFDPEDWYIHIGTPEQRIGLNFIGMFQATSYFMVGTYIHGMPAPPSQVSEILGGIDLDFMRDENKLANGGGFAFGASLEVNTGRLEFLIFYGQFGAGAGFDIMLKNYRDARCVGSTDRIGINGWYASGQAWAYVQGSIGVFVNLKFIKGEFEILKIGAAAVLQAKLPNPLWMQGIVGGQFSILGGLVKGNCKFKVTIGQMCEIQGMSSVTGVKVIAEVQPKSNEPEVSVFTAPQVAFNVPVNKEFEMLDANNNYKAYRVKLDHFKVTHNKVELPGTIQWNENLDVAIFNPSEILPPQSKVVVTVKVTWEEKVSGSWRALGTNGNVESETDGSEFTTGTAPDHIPEENVLYSYPVTSQFNFFKSEHPQGYLKLKVGQSYLFTPQDNGQTWRFVTRFSPAGQPAGTDVPLTYDQGTATVRYTIPTSLTNDKPYAVRFVKVPSVVNAIDKNVTSSNQQLASNEAGTVSTQVRDIEGVYTLAKEKQIYESFFRTSKYSTFLEKINSMTGYLTVGRIIPGIQVAEPGSWGFLNEVFDVVDLKGHNDIPPLLQLEALPTNPWYTDKIYPLIYQYYPFNTQKGTITWRQKDPAGIPPLKGMFFEQNIETPALRVEDVSTNNVTSTIGGRVTFVYSLSYFSFYDYFDLKTKAFDLYLNNMGSAPVGAYRLMASTSFYDVINGQYQFKLSYRLPGTNTVSSSKTFNIDW